MLVEEHYPATLPWYDKIGVIQQNQELEQLYRVLTQKHTQKLANMVLGEYGGKPKDEIRNQVYCQEWVKSKNSNVKAMITINTEKMWNAHTR